MASTCLVLLFLFVAGFDACSASQFGLGSRLLAREDQTLVSDNGTFAFGFTPTDEHDRFQLAIWFAGLPGDRTIVWSAIR